MCKFINLTETYQVRVATILGDTYLNKKRI